MENCAAVVGRLQRCFSADVRNLEKFLSSGSTTVDALVQLKSCVDVAHFCFGQSVTNDFLTDGFSDEQIWQQLKCLTDGSNKAIEESFSALNRKRRKIHSSESSVSKKSKDAGDETAWLCLGKATVSDFMGKGLSEDEIWEQLKSASKRGDRTFQAAFAYLQKQRVEKAAESTESSMANNGKNEEADSSDDEYLKKICNNWGINLKKGGEKDGDDVEGDELSDDDDAMGDGTDEGEDKEFIEGKTEDSDNQEENMSASGDEHGLEMFKKSLGRSNKRSEKPSIVDDRFFKLDEMSVFLEKMDKLENKNNAAKDDDDDDADDEIDYFDESSDDDENDEKNAKYSDFFDDPEAKSADEDDADEDDASEDDQNESDDEKQMDDDHLDHDDDDVDDGDKSSDEDDPSQDESHDKIKENQIQNSSMKTDSKELKSAFQIRQESLRKQIAAAEDSNMEKRPWYLMGEVTASERPEDSLLTRHLDFKFNDAPTIDECDDETVPSAEEILRKNYESEAFVVNVTRKVKPTETTFKYRKEVVLNQEKSKLGLAEIYEKEYLALSEKQKEEADEEYKENRKILDNLLCGLRMMFSDGPVSVLPPKMELKVLENLPSVTLEEVAPLGVSDASRLTAEEIQGRRKTELVGETERTKTDRNRARRKKKNFQHQMALQKKARAANPDSKEALEQAQKQLEKKSKRGKHVTIHQTDKKKRKMSSKDFFEKLQNQVSSKINKKKDKLNSKDKKTLNFSK